LIKGGDVMADAGLVFKVATEILGNNIFDDFTTHIRHFAKKKF
jgi:hypothetical protein